MEYTFTVKTMTCDHCEKTVTRAVQRLDRAAVVQIDRAANQVVVQSNQTAQVLAEAISEEGFTVTT